MWIVLEKKYISRYIRATNNDPIYKKNVKEAPNLD